MHFLCAGTTGEHLPTGVWLDCVNLDNLHLKRAVFPLDVLPRRIPAQAFGSVASIETAYYLKTGKQLLLSEQNLMDCAWDYGNTGCLGGFQALAYNYMHDKLEIASAEVTHFCYTADILQVHGVLAVVIRAVSLCNGDGRSF